MLRHKYKSILGPIPDDWSDRSVASLLSAALPGDWGDDVGEVTMAVLRSTNFTDAGNLVLSEIAQRGFSEAKANDIQVMPDDILLERSGGGPDRPVGRVVRIPREMPRTGFANFVQCLRPNRNEVVPEFLFWSLYQLHRCGQVARVQHQTTQMRNLDLRDYLRLRLPYPDRSEQEQIAQVLTAAAEHVLALEQQDRAIRKVKHALMQSLFIAGMPYARHELTEAHGVVYPKAWRLVRLGDILTESEYGLSAAFSEKGAYQILRMENVADGRVHAREPVYLDLSEEEFERYRVRKGDILFNRTNSWDLVGRVGIAHEDLRAVFASYLVRLRAKTSDVDPFFLNYALNSPSVKQRYRRFVTPAVSQANINVRNLRQTWIAIPDRTTSDEQERILETLLAVDHYRTALASQIAAACRTKQSLVQNLLTGRLCLRP